MESINAFKLGEQKSNEGGGIFSGQRDSVDTVKMISFEEDDFGEDDMEEEKASPPRKTFEVMSHTENRRASNKPIAPYRQSGPEHHRRSTNQNEEDSHLATVTERTHEESMINMS